MREAGELMPYVIPQLCQLIFELRVGTAMRSGAGDGASPETLARILLQDIEEGVHVDAARNAAGVIYDRTAWAWTRAHFELVTGDISESDPAWHECLRLYASLMHVAREAWEIEDFAPGCAFRGLSLLLNSMYKRRTETKEGKQRNLLAALNPSGMERRIARSCGDLLGINVPHARLLVDAHELLLHFSERHELIAAGDATATRKELARLRGLLKA